jgi:hypothetical protein
LSDLRDRRLNEPAAEEPFEHEHSGDWVPMVFLRAVEVERDGWIRREVTYSCPSCRYELTESTPARAVELAASELTSG